MILNYGELLIYRDEIILTAYNADTEPDRLIRLERVVGYVFALAEHYGNENICSRIESLHDHKGLLTVTWHVQPTDGEKEFLSKAWKSSIGDGADNVEHALA